MGVILVCRTIPLAVVDLWVASPETFQHNSQTRRPADVKNSTGPLQERWLSGRKRRFAKSVNLETGSAGSNPVRSVARLLS